MQVSMAVSPSSTYHQLRPVKQASMTYAMALGVSLPQSTASIQGSLGRLEGCICSKGGLHSNLNSVEAYYTVCLFFCATSGMFTHS